LRDEGLALRVVELEAPWWSSAARNEALDRLFGVDKLRDVLKGLSPKPVRDAVAKLEAERQRATARLTGAVTQIGAARTRAFDQAMKDGLTEAELSWTKATALAHQMYSDIVSIAVDTSVAETNIDFPQNLDDVDAFVRALGTAIGKIRRSDAEAQASQQITNRILAIRGIAGELARKRTELSEFDAAFSALRDAYGNRGTWDETRRQLESSVEALDSRINRLGVVQRITADTLTYLRSNEGATTCPACTQPIDRLTVVAQLDQVVAGALQQELLEAEEARRSQLTKSRDLDAAFDQHARLERTFSEKQAELDALEERARTVLAEDIRGDGIGDALAQSVQQLEADARELNVTRQQREEALQRIEATRERFKKIVNYLKEDYALREASSRLGRDDPGSSITDAQLGALQALESDIELIGRALAEEASVRARTLLDDSAPAIEDFFRRLCNHPYFDHLAISVERPRVGGLEDHKEALADVLTHLRAHLQLVVATQDDQFAQMLARSWGEQCGEYRLTWTARSGSHLLPDAA